MGSPEPSSHRLPIELLLLPSLRGDRGIVWCMGRMSNTTDGETQEIRDIIQQLTPNGGKIKVNNTVIRMSLGLLALVAAGYGGLTAYHALPIRAHELETIDLLVIQLSEQEKRSTSDVWNELLLQLGESSKFDLKTNDFDSALIYLQSELEEG